MSKDSVQNEFDTHAKSNKLPVAEITNINRGELSPTLELKVNIEGQAHNILLPLNALHNYGFSGPAGVEELRKIRLAVEQQLPDIRNALDHIGKRLPVAPAMNPSISNRP